MLSWIRFTTMYFNPRSPCGERPFLLSAITDDSYFNPRSPCGERRAGGDLCAAGIRISTHAPRAGSDRWKLPAFLPPQYFNPRSPCGERRGNARRRREHITDFNPRSPCGERHVRPTIV